jgi:hypothetical protein
MTTFKKDAHRGPVTGVQCFIQEPIFVTSSPDNSIQVCTLSFLHVVKNVSLLILNNHIFQVWIFDMPDGDFRLYSSRSGHYKPSNRIRFYGSPACNIVSAGTDATLRSFHVYNETYSRCISRAKLPLHHLKMKPNSLDDEFMPEILDFTDGRFVYSFLIIAEQFSFMSKC